MSWSEKKTRDRVDAHMEAMGEIEVLPLARQVVDLEALLSETSCRDVFGAHVYGAVTNFDTLSSDPTMKREAYQRLIQTTHVYQREASRIAESVFSGYRVHFQGSKVHVLFYRPINDEKKIAVQAVLFLLVLNDFVTNVFNAAFGDYPDWKIGGGADIGHAIGTRNGKRGERELLFIGTPANQAAKIIADRSSLRLTPAVWASLPADLCACCTQLASGNYKIAASRTTLQTLCSAHGIKWDSDASAARVTEDKASFPLKDIDYSDAEVPIDFAGLGWKNSKRVTAASSFADVSGFTQFVKDAEDRELQQEALRFFHVVRTELTKVASTDYDGVHVQFQGDRIETLVHLPKGDSAAIAVKAVEVAIGMQSSFEQVIKPEFPAASALTLKIGIDLGTTLATRLGTRGDRDNVCLGTPVENAAALEERCSGSTIGISKAVYDGLDGSDLQKHFVYESALECWVGRDLVWERLDALEDEQSYSGGKGLAIGLGAAAAGAALAYVISVAKSKDEPQVQPSRTHADS